jgi:hypothetical protein
MGLDVNLYAEGDYTTEELQAADAYLLARSTLPDPAYNDGHAIVRDSDTGRVELYTLARYYGPGYERGDWPTIYGAIRLMQTAFPRCRVYYGSDSMDDGEECTDEFLAELWEHFLGPNGDDYRTRAW